MRIWWEYDENMMRIQWATSEYKSETYEMRSIDEGIDEFESDLGKNVKWVYMRWVAFYVRFFCSVVNQLKV